MGDKEISAIVEGEQDKEVAAIAERNQKIIDEIQDRPGFLDMIQMKIISRKLFVWIIATVLLILGKVSASEWMYLSAIYIGANAVVSLVSIMKGAVGYNKEGSA